jgi:hypothetical protein
MCSWTWETKWKLRSVKVLELFRIMSGKISSLGLIMFAILDLEFSSSRFVRFRTTQLNKVVRIRKARLATTNPPHNLEAFVDGA